MYCICFWKNVKQNKHKLYKEIAKYEHEGGMRMIPRIESGNESEIKLICSDNDGIRHQAK